MKTIAQEGYNLCHLDKLVAWAAKHLKERYDIDPPEVRTKPASSGGAQHRRATRLLMPLICS